jgi:hypothetical protein
VGCGDECEEPTSTSLEESPATAAIQTVTGVADTSSGEAGGSGSASSGEPAAVLPEVVAIDLPAEVNAAGPVPITVHTHNAVSASLRLDGVDIGELAGAGKDVFVGELSIKGAVDNGLRHVEVTATRGDHEASASADIVVQAPAAGKPAWSKPGPAGSRANRIALTPEGDVIEAGLRIGAGIPRASVHKRSGFDGGDLWGKKVLLSELEGHVADVAIAADGSLWVAMNVKEASQKWRPHVLHLTPDGLTVLADVPGVLGHTLRGIAADAEGGAFAVGYGVVEGGDLDVVYQGVSAAGQGTVADAWDYQPGAMSHVFADAAMAVVIDGDTAWIAGLSSGMHANFESRARGLVVPLDIHTGASAGTVVIAPAIETWEHSMFFAITLTPAGVVVTGAGCEDACGGVQRIETSRYAPDGSRTWFQPEVPADGAYGSSVAVDSQGRAIVAGASKDGGVLRGQVFARVVGQVGPDHDWAYLFPYSKEPSEALAVAVDTYDRVFVDGYVTAAGSPSTWLVQLSP